ncbi:hypothetical protein BU14_0530s0008 [Porphyra umbilicalis]|uniref:Uncharacterized protein n=1 Tax=Porphyra umbilicalis TaxID=2786 RepID=A0A1X6NSA8_PORUM|nr:hypothetical protein BU14_0530s0008 [Porphyra umbilicalis]|eukprot:OSX71468.1 hypothetical protein BU14_0530s0008 [Porphyra umbilicalis]
MAVTHSFVECPIFSLWVAGRNNDRCKSLRYDLSSCRRIRFLHLCAAAAGPARLVHPAAAGALPDALGRCAGCRGARGVHPHLARAGTRPCVPPPPPPPRPRAAETLHQRRAQGRGARGGSVGPSAAAARPCPRRERRVRAPAGGAGAAVPAAPPAAAPRRATARAAGGAGAGIPAVRGAPRAARRAFGGGSLGGEPPAPRGGRWGRCAASCEACAACGRRWCVKGARVWIGAGRAAAAVEGRRRGVAAAPSAEPPAANARQPCGVSRRRAGGAAECTRAGR